MFTVCPVLLPSHMCACRFTAVRAEELQLGSAPSGSASSQYRLIYGNLFVPVD
jgi:hypothetical protein